MLVASNKNYILVASNKKYILVGSNKSLGGGARWRFYSSTAKRLVQEQDICAANYIFILFFCILEKSWQT